MQEVSHRQLFFFQVRSLDRERVSESRVQIFELVDHLHGKCSGKPEVAECNAPPSNKCQGTQGSNEPSSIIAPEIKVSFNTQEKMAWNTKRRYESVMVAKIKPLFAQFSSKNAVEVIGVRKGAFCFCARKKGESL